MKNDISVEEVIELKEELEMENIMKLQDGITKDDAVAIINEEVSVEEIVEIKEEMQEALDLAGIRIESQKVPNFAKEGLDDMQIIKLDEPKDDGVKFTEIMDKPSNNDAFGIIDSVKNVNTFEVSFEVWTKTSKFTLLFISVKTNRKERKKEKNPNEDEANES